MNIIEYVVTNLAFVPVGDDHSNKESASILLMLLLIFDGVRIHGSGVQQKETCVT